MLTRLANSNRHKMQQSYRKRCPMIREELSSDKGTSSWLSLAHSRAWLRISQRLAFRGTLLMVWVASLRPAHSTLQEYPVVVHKAQWVARHHRSVPHWGLPRVGREPLLQPFSEKNTSHQHGQQGGWSNPQQKWLYYKRATVENINPFPHLPCVLHFGWKEIWLKFDIDLLYYQNYMHLIICSITLTEE